MTAVLNKTDKRALVQKYLHSYLSVIVAVALAVSAVFAIMSIGSGSSFLGAMRYKFSKTPNVLTVGEQLIEVFSYLSPLFLSFAFFLMFFTKEKLPQLKGIVLSIATLITLSGITLFVCLNTYNIIDLFNTLSKNADYTGPEMKAYYTNTIILLTSYQVLLPVFAGTLVRFVAGVRKTIMTDTVDIGGASAFAITGLALSLWHILALPLSSRLMREYFQHTSTESSGYYMSEIASILCALLTATFAYIYYLKGKEVTKANK